MYYRLLIAMLLLVPSAYVAAQTSEPKPPVIAPFSKLDTVCVNDWWNRKKSPIVDVNPLSLLTPGVFRELFRRPPPDLSQ